MIRRTAAVLSAALILSPLTAYAGTSGTVTPEEYAAAHAGQSRARIENDFGTHGHRTGMIATDTRRILWKRYEGTGGEVYEVTLWGPLCPCGPMVGPYQMHSKRQVPGA